MQLHLGRQEELYAESCAELRKGDMELAISMMTVAGSDRLQCSSIQTKARPKHNANASRLNLWLTEVNACVRKWENSRDDQRGIWKPAAR